MCWKCKSELILKSEVEFPKILTLIDRLIDNQSISTWPLGQKSFIYY